MNKLCNTCWRESENDKHRYKRSADEKTGNTKDPDTRKVTLLETSVYDALLFVIYLMTLLVAQTI
jgi:thiamine biosynthesis lipoprotein ApbE